MHKYKSLNLGLSAQKITLRDISTINKDYLQKLSALFVLFRFSSHKQKILPHYHLIFAYLLKKVLEYTLRLRNH